MWLVSESGSLGGLQWNTAGLLAGGWVENGGGWRAGAHCSLQGLSQGGDERQEVLGAVKERFRMSDWLASSRELGVGVKQSGVKGVQGTGNTLKCFLLII